MFHSPLLPGNPAHMSLPRQHHTLVPRHPLIELPCQHITGNPARDCHRPTVDRSSCQTAHGME
eukprot:2856589-Pyramimonas_sp.AAC.1